MTYNHQEIEEKWQKHWEDGNAHRVVEDSDKKDSAKYHLAMFPYPSGSGLHVGHVESYTAVDIMTRYRRMQGDNVLHPMGFDAFGLPAENYAIKTGVHPKETTEKAINTFKQQLKSLGLSYDWDREISTAKPSYYKWTQWLFLLLYKNDLAYRAKAPVNWCDGCQTVLANEQVVDGACERCDTEVVQKELKQWFFRITEYADELLDGLEDLDWPKKIKAMQKNWIGKSEGAEIEFHGILQETSGDGNEKMRMEEFSIPVYTTRPDTLMGVTYLVLAPEHPLVDDLSTEPYWDKVVAYREQAEKKTELERTDLDKTKSGQFIGAYATHPITEEEIPIYIADYAMMRYGTGAVMGVPAHDERDFAFARKHDLEIRQVIAPPEQDKAHATVNEAYTGKGILVNSGDFNGLTNEDAKEKITDELESIGQGDNAVRYRLRDWLVSRQRYWGAPIPIIICEDCGDIPVDPKDLPVELPLDVDFEPTGKSPLVDQEDFHDVACPECGKDAKRESDTMDTFVDSSWYFLRYTDPKNKEVMADSDKVDYWCPVDLYVGGAEHAVMHLLYARFITRALNDLGYLDFAEPFETLRNQGMILGPDGDKMSKSKGNVINPDDIVSEYGADAIRMYEMFMGPFDAAKPWNTEGLVGVRRFLDKAWSMKEKLGDVKNPDMESMLHKTIKQVTEDLEVFKFNTAIAQMMECVNLMKKMELVSREAYGTFVRLLAPFAPHLSEELWSEVLGRAGSVFEQDWPAFDKEKAKDDMIEVAVQVDGKLRGTIEVSPDLGKEAVLERAKAHENVQKYLDGEEIEREIFVPGRLVNFVV